MIGALDLLNITDVFFEKKYKQGGNVELYAPNGKPSNLTPEQYKLVRTPEFKAWFGDWENDLSNASKVVDENGEPMVVYHGTLKGGFTIFNMGKFTENEWGNIWGASHRSGSDPTAFLGSHFAKEKNVAEKFLTNIYSHQGDKPKIYECFLNIRKIKIIDEKELQEELVVQNLYEHWAIDREFEYSEEFYEMDSEELQEKYENDKSIRKKVNENVLGQEHSDALSFASYMADEYKNKNKNIDGIEYVNRIEGGISYIAFEPNQIKLADGTNTTFDDNNPDIRLNIGGEIWFQNNR